MPTSNSHWMMPWVSPAPSITWLSTPELGRFTRMAPKPMGSSRVGSYSFLMASQMSTAPTTYMTACCQVMDSRPSHKNSMFLLPSFSRWYENFPHTGRGAPPAGI